MPVPPFVANYVPSDTLSTLGWQAANFIVNATLISTAVAAVQCPLDSLKANWMMNNRLLPPCAGKLAVVRSLYTGLLPHLTSSSTRTAYVTTAKSGSSSEKSESAPQWFARMGYIALVSLGEVLATQIPESKKDLTYFGLDFNWRGSHNLFKLCTIGMGARYSATMINFFALCVGEEYYATLLSNGNHFVAGALSGVSASIASYPFAYYRDILFKSTRVEAGNLISPSVSDLACQAAHYVKREGILATAKKIGSEFAVCAPLRLAKTGATFAVVSGVGAALGNEPLARLGFFRGSPKLLDSEMELVRQPKRI